VTWQKQETCAFISAALQARIDAGFCAMMCIVIRKLVRGIAPLNRSWHRSQLRERTLNGETGLTATLSNPMLCREHLSFTRGGDYELQRPCL
jgi:hypothetical protein